MQGRDNKENHSLVCIWCLLPIIFFSYAHAETPKAKASLQLEVVIPERAAMYFSDEPAVSSDVTLLASRRTAPGASFTTVFNLDCATYGDLPDSCHRRLLDTQGRAYPPFEKSANGDITAGDFPQFFESATKTLRVFTPSPSWKILVDMVQEPGALSTNNFSVFSSLSGWHCLGFHPDWRLSPSLETCPTFADATSSGVPVVTVTQSSGGWYDITLGLKLRLDGSEPAGSYDGVLRYTLVSF